MGDGDVVHSQGSFSIKPTSQISQKLSRHLPALCRRMNSVRQPLEGAQPDIFSTRTAYKLLFTRVVDYGEIYQAMQSVTVDPTGMEATATIQFPQRIKQPNELFYLHPTFFDAMFHVAGFVANLQGEPNDAFICTGVRSVHITNDIIDEAASYSIYCCNSWIEDENLMLADTYAVKQDAPKKIIAHIKCLQFHRVCLDSFKRNISMTVDNKQRKFRNAGSASIYPIVEPYTPSCSNHQDAFFPTQHLTPTLEQAIKPSSLTSSFLSSPATSNPSSQPSHAKDLMSSVLGLCVDEIDENDDLESLGLDSLTTIEAIHRFKYQWGQDLPRDFFRRYNTIRKIQKFFGSELVREPLTPPHTGDVHFARVPSQIQSASSGYPLFLIHDGSGTVSYYDRMSSLGRDVWIIPNPHFGDDVPWQWDNLESMAREYIGYVTRADLGPILIGGLSSTY